MNRAKYVCNFLIFVAIKTFWIKANSCTGVVYMAGTNRALPFKPVLPTINIHIQCQIILDTYLPYNLTSFLDAPAYNIYFVYLCKDSSPNVPKKCLRNLLLMTTIYYSISLLAAALNLCCCTKPSKYYSSILGWERLWGFLPKMKNFSSRYFYRHRIITTVSNKF